MFFPHEKTIEFGVQCKLSRGQTIQYSALPKRFAEVGKPVSLRAEDGSWEDGWLVAEVYGGLVPLIDRHVLSKSHLRATGDSLPKKKKA